MNLIQGRPEITAEDHPATVFAALLGSIAICNKEMPANAAWQWVKVAQDAYETVQDAFGIVDEQSGELSNPLGSALLYLSLGQLEYALVGYGVKALDEAREEDVAIVDNLLMTVDSLRESTHCGD